MYEWIRLKCVWWMPVSELSVACVGVGEEEGRREA